MSLKSVFIIKEGPFDSRAGQTAQAAGSSEQKMLQHIGAAGYTSFSQLSRAWRENKIRDRDMQRMMKKWNELAYNDQWTSQPEYNEAAQIMQSINSSMGYERPEPNKFDDVQTSGYGKEQGYVGGGGQSPAPGDTGRFD
jgi:hypothetical protein